LKNKVYKKNIDVFENSELFIKKLLDKRF